jgi:putative addiction module component (TIGR02574 family)
MSVAEVLAHALALSPDERANLAQSLLRSLPAGPAFYRNESELGAELQRRQQEFAAEKQGTYSADETIRRAREAVAQVRK